MIACNHYDFYVINQVLQLRLGEEIKTSNSPNRHVAAINEGPMNNKTSVWQHNVLVYLLLVVVCPHM